MGLFCCSKCNALENTALGEYWHQVKKPLCSECAKGKWHGRFEKIDASEFLDENPDHVKGARPDEPYFLGVPINPPPQ